MPTKLEELELINVDLSSEEIINIALSEHEESDFSSPGELIVINSTVVTSDSLFVGLDVEKSINSSVTTSTKFTIETGPEVTFNSSVTSSTLYPFLSDTVAPTISDGTITSSNVTENTADFSWTKATDDVSDQTTLVYKLYRALEDPDAPEESDLTTLAEIDSNGKLVITGTDVATLSEDGTNIVQDEFYNYNVTVEDEAGNRALYTQETVQYISPTVNSVTIDEDFDYQDEGDGTVQLSADIDADNVDNLTINWSSSNTEIATVDSNGLVTFVATGEVTITAESDFDNTVKDTLTFTIYEFSAPSEESSFTTTA